MLIKGKKVSGLFLDFNFRIRTSGEPETSLIGIIIFLLLLLLVVIIIVKWGGTANHNYGGYDDYGGDPGYDHGGFDLDGDFDFGDF